MSHVIALLGRVLGRLRRRPAPVAPPGGETTPVVVPLRPAPEALCGEEVALVRPYYVAYEWQRPMLVRRALWMTCAALELGPLVAHPGRWQEDEAA
ncbi:MAG: hypothetical protein HOY76_25895 [Streptomyces sp.]|nr:hypothetical protein [Streptomyces sp.]NUS12603.1 hypothetical protein [Streptomyces sp.]